MFEALRIWEERAEVDMSDNSQRNVVVIGGGPGGYPAAIRAARLGGAVTLVDKGGLGGTCLHRGCIPTKSMLKYVHDYQVMKRVLKDASGGPPPAPSLTAMMNQKNDAIRHLSAGTRALLEKNGVRIISGTAVFQNRHTVRVLETGEELPFLAAIIATGSKSMQLPIEGLDYPGVLNSDRILDIKEIPGSITVIGGGYIGLEFAQIFQALGVRVTVIELLENILPTEDPDVAQSLMKIMKSTGISFHTASRVTRISQADETLCVAIEKEGREDKLFSDRVLMAVGRRAYTEGLGLENIGIRVQGNGAIAVNEHLETSIPNIFAVGDAVGGVMLAHKASAEGETAACCAVGIPSTAPYRVIPSVMYTKPEVARVGLLEGAAREKYGEILIGRFPFAANGRAVLEGNFQGFIKVIAEAKSECIVGVSILGPDAGHLIGEATLAVEMEATLADVADTVHAHPTLSEALREAVLDAKGEAVHIPPTIKKVRERPA